MAHVYDDQTAESDVAALSLTNEEWWQQIEGRIEQSIADYTQSLWDRLQSDAGLQSFQQQLEQSQRRWQESGDETLLPEELNQQLLDYLEGQKVELKKQFDGFISQGKQHLSQELSQLRHELWQENQQKIKQFIQPSYQLISEKIGQNKQLLEQNWQQQRQQMEQQQTQLIRSLDAQIRNRLKPIIKNLEHELQYSYNLRERIRSVLTQFENMIKNRSQKAWQKIDAVVKRQQDTWQQHNQQLSERLNDWQARWVEEDQHQKSLLEKSQEFSRRLEHNIELFHQQIDEPRKALLVQGQRAIQNEIKQMVGQLRRIGMTNEEQLKSGIQRMMQRWQNLVRDFNSKQQHFNRSLLEANQGLKEQQNKLLSVKLIQDKENEKIQQLKQHVFQHLGRADAELQEQLQQLRSVAESGMEQIEQLINDRLVFFDQQLLTASEEEQRQIEAMAAKLEHELIDKLQQLFEQRLQQLQIRLGQRHDHLEEEQRQLQDDLLTRLQKDCLDQLEQHREQLRQQFDMLQSSLTKSEQQLKYEIKTLVSNYKIGYTDLDGRIQDEIHQFQTRIEQHQEQIQQGYQRIFQQQQQSETKLSENLDELTQRSESTAQELESRLNGLWQETESRLKNFSEKVDKELVDFNQTIKDQSQSALQGVKNEQKELQSRLHEAHEKIDQQQKGMQQQVTANAALLEQRIAEIERRQQDYLSNNVLLERAEQMRRELLDNIDYLRKEGQLVGKIRLQVNDVKEDLNRNNRLSDEIATRLKSFHQQEVDLNQVEARLQHMLKLSQDWDNRWQSVQETQQQYEQFAHRFQEMEKLHGRTAEFLQHLHADAEQLAEERRNSEQQQLQLHQLEEKISELRRKVVPLEANFRRLNALENSIQQQQTSVESLTLRAESLQATLNSIDGRIDKVYQARDFIGRTETRVEELNRQLQQRLQALEQVSEQPQQGGQNRAPDSDTKNTVIQLHRKGWTKKEISRATRLSVGAVELILELAPRQ